jgi:transcriptional antiterminator NusG
MVVEDNRDDIQNEMTGDGEGGPQKEEEAEEETTTAELQDNYGVILTSGELSQNIIAGKHATYSADIKNISKKDDKVHLSITTIDPLRSEESPEWFLKLLLDGNQIFENEMVEVMETEFKMEGGSTKNIKMDVTAPHSVEYGERVDIVLTCKSQGDPAQSASKTFTVLVKQSILAIKTSIGHERTVADTLYGRAKRKDAGIYSILAPEKLRGYVLVETINPDGLGKLVKGIKRARGVVEGNIPFDEINHFLTPKPLVSGIVVGDIVELIAGPFKGEKARVQQIDEAKEEITVELFEAVVPIPITIRGDHVRVLETERR